MSTSDFEPLHEHLPSADCNDFKVAITDYYHLRVEISKKDLDEIVASRNDARRKNKESQFHP